MNTTLRHFAMLAVVCPFALGLASPAPAAQTPAARPAYRGLLLETTDDEKSPVKVWAPDGTPVLEPFYEFARQGLALVDRDCALRLDGGCFYSGGAEEYLGAGLKQTGAMTFAVYLQPFTNAQAGAGCIATFGSASNLLFAVWQEGDTLLFDGGMAAAGRSRIARLTSNAPFHLAVAADRRQARFYLDGAAAGTGAGLAGDFAAWDEGRLYLGNDGGGRHPWRGMLEGVALYNEALGPERAGAVAAAMREALRQRPAPARIALEGTLLARSEYPRPWDEGFTYRDVLSLCEYKVDRIVRGAYKGAKIRVAEWMYVDRIFLKNSATAIGARRTLEVEELDANPQLSTTHRADSLDLDMDAVVYYDRGPIEALPPERQPRPPAAH